VRRVIARHDVGETLSVRVPRQRNHDEVAGRSLTVVEKSQGRISSKRLLSVAQ
jgi:hypothetical protein